MEKEHGYFKQIPGWDEPGLLCRLAFCHDGDPTCMLSWAVPVHADRPSSLNCGDMVGHVYDAGVHLRPRLGPANSPSVYGPAFLGGTWMELTNYLAARALCLMYYSSSVPCSARKLHKLRERARETHQPRRELHASLHAPSRWASGLRAGRRLRRSKCTLRQQARSAAGPLDHCDGRRKWNGCCECEALRG